MKKDNERDKIFLKLLLKNDATQVTDEEVVYFRENPDEIEEVTAPLNLHLYFLWIGTLIGFVLVAVAKYFAFSGVLDAWHAGVKDFIVDVMFEMGVALIGAALTAYLLGVLLDKQQNDAAKWRTELRRRIDEGQVS